MSLLFFDPRTGHTGVGRFMSALLACPRQLDCLRRSGVIRQPNGLNALIAPTVCAANAMRRVDDRSIGESEGKSHIGLELGGMVVSAVGLVAPGADGFRGGGGEHGVSA